MKKFIIFIFLLSSCSLIDETGIQEKNVDLTSFLSNTGAVSSSRKIKNIKKQNASTGLVAQNSTGNETIKSIDDLEKISIEPEKIIASETGSTLTDSSGSISVENSSEEDVKELIDILIESSK